MQGKNSAEALVGKTIGGRYRLDGLLGHGGFADVFKAWDNLDDVFVAFKVLKVPGHLSADAQREFVARFHEEAKLTRRTFKGMPQVRQVLDMGVAELAGAGLGQPWMAMELLEGETLHEWLRRRRGSPTRLSPREALDMLRPVLEAAAFAHERGVAHRDLKPANVFLAREADGTTSVKVLDFGIAKVLQGDEASSGNTMTSSTLQMFSPQYGAPEQFAAKKTGKYTDVFALGLIFTELLTDKAPLSEAGDRTECMMAALDKRERPTPRSASVHVAPALEAALERAVALKEADRHADAAELLRELTAAVADAATAPPRAPEPPPRAPEPPPRAPEPPPRAPEPTARAPEPVVATSFAENLPAFDPAGEARARAEQAERERQAERGERDRAAAREQDRLRSEQQRAAEQAASAASAANAVSVAEPITQKRGPSTGLLLGLTAGALALLVAIGAVGTVAVRAMIDKGDAGLAEVRDDSDSPVPVTAADPVWGERDAPVTLVIFSDFQCPYCGKAAATLEQLRADYGPDKLRMVWKNEPLAMHDKAKPAAEAAMGVFALKGSAAFWSFHDTAFKNQKELSPDSYEKWAAAADVDVAKLKEGLTGHTWAKKVDEDHELAKKIGVSGTPAFFVNGVRLSGAQPIEKFKELIDKELEKAQAKVDAGTPKNRVYVAMSTENQRDAGTQKQGEGDGEKEDTSSVFRVPVGSSPVVGPSDAQVTIVLFSDFQCPYCKKVGPTLGELRTKYGERVRVVWKNEPLPFHPRAEPAAELALEARAQKGDRGFWAAHDKLFESQPKLEDTDLEKIAADLGLDVARVKEAIRTHKHKSAIDADLALAEEVEASGTPHAFVNGRRLVGAQPFERFAALVDEELKKTDALLAGGTPRSGVYDALMKDAKGPAPLEKKAVAPPPASAAFKGNANASVVIQEFSDFQCPFCSRVGPTLDALIKSGDVKVVWRHLPLSFHPNAMPAAEAAEEALKQKGPEGFWQMHDKLFANQKDGLDRPALDKYAQELGLDTNRFKAALDGHVHKAKIEADAAAAQAAGISGTPAFSINGYFISGAQPYAKFKRVVDRARADAR